MITGASDGFGKSIALRLNSLGYTVAVTSREISKFEDFPDEIIKIESKMASFDECEEVIQKAIEKMGSVDVLINNASDVFWASFEESPDRMAKDIFNTNFTVPQYLIKSVLPHFREKKNGTIVNITSTASLQPWTLASSYSASKAALEGLTRVLKSECQRFARFMTVIPVSMGTKIKQRHLVFDTKISEYMNLQKYSPEIKTTLNRRDIAAQQIINVVNMDKLPQSFLIGTEAYLIMENEIQRSVSDYENCKDVTLSVCDKV